MAKEINKYTTVAVPGDGNVNLKVMVPAKYIKYFQSMSNIKKLMAEINKLKKDDPNYDAMQEVKNELEKVVEKYTLESQPISEKILREAGCDSSARQMIARLVRQDCLKKDATLRELRNYIDGYMKYIDKIPSSTAELKKFGLGTSSPLSAALELEDSIINSEVKKLIRELTSKHEVLEKLFGLKGDELLNKVTFKDLDELRCKITQPQNYRAQMKRQTEILKISALVNALGNDKNTVQNEMGAVRIL